MRLPLSHIVRLLPDSWILNLCTAGPVGKWGKAPGTNGTVLGILLYTVIFHQLNFVAQTILILIFAYLAVIICGEGEIRMQKKDPGEMILDEIVAIPICFLGLQNLMIQVAPVWVFMIAGFLIFRFFDILKPLGISRLQNYPGGVGVVLDDLAAAVATNLSLTLGASLVLLF